MTPLSNRSYGVEPLPATDTHGELQVGPVGTRSDRERGPIRALAAAHRAARAFAQFIAPWRGRIRLTDRITRTPVHGRCEPSPAATTQHQRDRNRRVQP